MDNTASVYCIETDECAYIVKSAEKAFEIAEDLADEDIETRRIFKRTVQDYIKFCSGWEPVPACELVERPAIAQPTEKKVKAATTTTKASASTKAKKQPAGALLDKVLAELKLHTKETALDYRALAAKIGANVESCGVSLPQYSKKGFVQRVGKGVQSDPFRYYIEKKIPAGFVACAARGGKKIPASDCNRNNELEACRGCKQ